jgi:ER lumen protein retaining receptor
MSHYMHFPVSLPISLHSTTGVSLKAQVLYLVVFCTRYVDVFTTFYSIYNFAMKIFYILLTSAIVYTIIFREPAKSTYSASQDDWPSHYIKILGPCLILALFLFTINDDWMGYLWTFSIFLESVAFLPQLIMFRKDRNMQVLVRCFIALRGIYRLLYIFNWVYRAHTEPHYRHHYLVYTAGGVQVLLYCDFWWYYISSYFNTMVGEVVQEQVKLPVDAAVPLLSEEQRNAETVLVVSSAPAAAAPPVSAISSEMQIV